MNQHIFKFRESDPPTWSYEPVNPRQGLFTARRLETTIYTRWAGKWSFVTTAVMVKYSTSLDGPSNSTLAFYLEGDE